MPFKRLAVLLLLVMACSQAETEDASLGVTWRKIGDSTYITEVVLTEGTPCAVVRSGYGVGLSCDWGER